MEYHASSARVAQEANEPLIGIHYPLKPFMKTLSCLSATRDYSGINLVLELISLIKSFLSAVFLVNFVPFRTTWISLSFYYACARA